MLPFYSQCFHRDFKIVLFVFQCLLDFFSKLLWVEETKLKGKHYCLFTTQSPAAMTEALWGGQPFLSTVSLLGQPISQRASLVFMHIGIGKAGHVQACRSRSYGHCSAQALDSTSWFKGILFEGSACAWGLKGKSDTELTLEVFITQIGMW